MNGTMVTVHYERRIGGGRWREKLLRHSVQGRVHMVVHRRRAEQGRKQKRLVGSEPRDGWRKQIQVGSAQKLGRRARRMLGLNCSKSQCVPVEIEVIDSSKCMETVFGGGRGKRYAEYSAGDPDCPTCNQMGTNTGWSSPRLRQHQVQRQEGDKYVEPRVYPLHQNPDDPDQIHNLDYNIFIMKLDHVSVTPHLDHICECCTSRQRRRPGPEREQRQSSGSGVAQ